MKKSCWFNAHTFSVILPELQGVFWEVHLHQTEDTSRHEQLPEDRRCFNHSSMSLTTLHVKHANVIHNAIHKDSECSAHSHNVIIGTTSCRNAYVIFLWVCKKKNLTMNYWSIRQNLKQQKTPKPKKIRKSLFKLHPPQK